MADRSPGRIDKTIQRAENGVIQGLRRTGGSRRFPGAVLRKGLSMSELSGSRPRRVRCLVPQQPAGVPRQVIETCGEHFLLGALQPSLGPSVEAPRHFRPSSRLRLVPGGLYRWRLSMTRLVSSFHGARVAACGRGTRRTCLRRGRHAPRWVAVKRRGEPQPKQLNEGHHSGAKDLARPLAATKPSGFGTEGNGANGGRTFSLLTQYVEQNRHQDWTLGT